MGNGIAGLPLALSALLFIRAKWSLLIFKMCSRWPDPQHHIKGAEEGGTVGALGGAGVGGGGGAVEVVGGTAGLHPMDTDFLESFKGTLKYSFYTSV